MLRLGDDDASARDSVLAMLQSICPGADFTAEANGEVTAVVAAEMEGAGCDCLAAILASARTVTIRVDEAWAKIGGGGLTRDASEDDTANGTGSDETVYVDNKGAYDPHPDWVILAHELCGHALPGLQGTHPEWRPGRPGYDPSWHQEAIDAENRIRDEHDLPRR